MGLTYSLCVLDLFPLKPTSPDVILLGSTKQRYSNVYIKEPPVLVHTVTALLYFTLCHAIVQNDYENNFDKLRHVQKCILK